MEHTENLIETAQQEDGLENKFLTFNIGKEEYGIEVQYVTQILGLQKITELPEMPSFIQGVINLRGNVIPVIDVRLRFSFEKREYDERTCIIVIDINNVSVGLIVDQVKEVIDIPLSNIEPPPSVNKSVESQYIQGLGKIGDSVKIILNTQKMLFDNELAGC
jgi:purine-binding chemotaxis protein CheW